MSDPQMPAGFTADMDVQTIKHLQVIDDEPDARGVMLMLALTTDRRYMTLEVGLN